MHFPLETKYLPKQKQNNVLFLSSFEKCFIIFLFYFILFIRARALMV